MDSVLRRHDRLLETLFKTVQEICTKQQEDQMQDDRSISGLYLDSDRPGARAPSLWQRIVGGVAVAGVFALALTVSIALFAVVLTVGAIVWGYLWWKTRDLRRAIQQQMDARTVDAGMGSDAPRSGPVGARGVIIEGEVVREGEVQNRAAERDRTPH